VRLGGSRRGGLHHVSVSQRGWLRQDGDVTGAELLDEAAAELYTADPDGFIARRQELTTRAREAGQAAAARQIAALRKPTRSAWVINRLARSDPGTLTQLTDLGRDLRAAERARDGGAMRELAQRRRQLIASLVQQALAAAGQATAAAAMREELTGTFAAAIADPDVAGQLQQGTLVRAVLRAGFGSEQPVLSVVPSPADGKRRGKTRAAPAKPATAGPARSKTAKAGADTTDAGSAADEPEPGDAGPSESGTDESGPSESGPSESGPSESGPSESGTGASGTSQTGPARSRQDRAAAAERRRAEARAAEEQRRADARAAQERRRAEVRAKAERAVAETDQAVAAAEADQLEQQMVIRRLERELTGARRQLRAAGAEARRAEAAQRRARQALERLDG
jgi:hypothetical protein